METKNICGKIPIELHEKVRQELEGTEMTIPQFLTRVIEEHFEKKGVEKMAARTLAVQISEELFNRFKERFEKEKRQRPGRFSQKDYLIEIITKALDAADEEDSDADETPESYDPDEGANETQEPEEEMIESEEEDNGGDEDAEESDEQEEDATDDEHDIEEDETEETSEEEDTE